MRLIRSTAMLFVAMCLPAQRAFESDGQVIYEDGHGNRTSLGAGFNPVLTAARRVVFLRGRRFGYGERFDCGNKEAKNWVVSYDPVTRAERVVFDRIIPFDGGKFPFCIFTQMQLSLDESVLYLVSAVYATSGTMAIVHLARGSIQYVPGVNEIYLIETGPHRGEIIYQCRIWRETSDGGHPGYPFVHARPDGRPIREISDEYFTAGGNDEVPILRAYLRRIGGRITVGSQKIP